MTVALTAGAVDYLVARLDLWLDTMRGPAGYGGPVVHWWRDCLAFCGAAMDWRYEGIIAGYLTLYELTGAARWLDKAKRAGDDLLGGQTPSGHFWNSEFELNPGVGGTPHEAAADIGLLLLARALKAQGHADWERYLHAARRNLQRFYIEQLWYEPEGIFWDDPNHYTFVPNKSATLIEALCLLADLTGRDEYLYRYVAPTARAIVAHQRREPGGSLDGAIAQNTIDGTLVESYFPYYCARCVPGLLAAAQYLDDDSFFDAALAAITFVLRWRDPDGAFPQVVYPDGRVNRYPRWIAGIAAVLRALDAFRPHGLNLPAEPSLRWLLAGQLPSGAFATAEGFGSRLSQRRPSTPDFQDLLPVCGWADKAFRYLATQVGMVPGDATLESVLLPCTFQGRHVDFYEDEHEIALDQGGRKLYSWRKGTEWARIGTCWVVAL